MNKLIKLSDTHYIVVDGDSEIKEGDVYYTPKDGVYIMECGICNSISKIKDAIRLTGKPFYKITHSTQPLEQKTNSYSNGFNMKSMSSDVELVFDKIKPLSLSEVEEAINGYSVEKMAHNWATRQTTRSTDYWHSLVRAYKDAHKELEKDKVFTVEDMRKAYNQGMENQILSLQGEVYETDFEVLIQSLLPKTEWECTIDEQGKIVIL